ncbi:MAG: TrmH family RNA methyltransferase [Bdellovibrionales bacterium]
MKRAFEIRVVLAQPLYERNVGATSRAMSNMGFDHLILVNPQCEITFEAQQAAATGQEALQNRTVYSSWDEFYTSEPDSIRIGLTTKDGRARQVRDFRPTLEWIATESPYFQKESESPVVIHLIFGREDWGLSADDLERVNFACCLPTWGPNPSLNLAQAVLVALFMVRDTWGGTRTRIENQLPDKRKKRPDTQLAEESLRLWLEEMGMSFQNRRINAYTVLKRMLLQNTPTPKELRILEAVLQQSIRKLRERKELKRQLGEGNNS